MEHGIYLFDEICATESIKTKPKKKRNTVMSWSVVHLCSGDVRFMYFSMEW